MYPRSMVRQALGLGLLVTLVILALGACGAGGQEQTEGAAPYRRSRKLYAPANTARRNSSLRSPSESAKAGQWKSTYRRDPRSRRSHGGERR